MRRRSTRVLTVLLTGTLLFSAACGDDDDDTEASAGDEPTEQSAETDETDESTPASEAAQPFPEEPDAPATPPADGKTKPEFEIPAGAPPKELQIKDLEVGTGAEAKTGDAVVMQYVGKAYSNQKQFDASWDRGKPFPFRLGGGMVIKGWDEGIPGMKVGGRRQIIIPPDKGYGDLPPFGSGIGENDTLVFVVDLVSVG